MIRAIVSAIVSFLAPGFGHMFVNFQVIRGLIIAVAYVVITSVLTAHVGEVWGTLFLLLGRLYVPYMAYRDMRNKGSNK